MMCSLGLIVLLLVNCLSRRAKVLQCQNCVLQQVAASQADLNRLNEKVVLHEKVVLLVLRTERTIVVSAMAMIA
jgi:hypothetical protein